MGNDREIIPTPHLRLSDFEVLSRKRTAELGLVLGAHVGGVAELRVLNPLTKAIHVLYLGGKFAFERAEVSNMPRQAFKLNRTLLSLKILAYSADMESESGDIGLVAGSDPVIRVNVVPFNFHGEGEICSVNLLTGEIGPTPNSNDTVWVRHWEIHLTGADGSTEVIAARRP